MKKIVLFFIFAPILFLLFFAVLRVGFDLQGEDSWIKDANGNSVKHGNPSVITGVVRESQEKNFGVNLEINVGD